MEKKFPGKVLLFGEYTLLYNQRSLAIPFDKFKGSWSFKKGDHSHPDLFPWATWLQDLAKSEPWLLDDKVAQFSEELDNGLWFDSNIPLGYGMGSSGALVAAWYDRYVAADTNPSLLELKHRFARLESFFHGTSSGFDPLISYRNKAILMDHKELREIASKDQLPLLDNCFLLDTGISRSTEPLVKLFRKKSDSIKFREQVLPKLIQAQVQAMDAFILQEKESLEAAFLIISTIQFEHLSDLIPNGLKTLWEKGLSEKDYLLKLCGAGGGGCMLGWGIAPNNEYEIIDLKS